MTQNLDPYNPLAKRSLASSVVAKLLRQEPEVLPPPEFQGAGIYLLYYTGDFKAYQPIATANAGNKFSQPIYVGKAVPAGSRTGGLGLDTPHGRALCNRLVEHGESIAATANLKIEDFRCRWLVVDEVFIPLGETLLISHFRPLWNLILVGFGNHPPGKGRKGGKKPLWDVLHPGRQWAKNLKASATSDQVLVQIAQHFNTTQTPPVELDL